MKCPTCGRRMAQPPQPRLSPEERQAQRVARIRAATDRRAERDRVEILPRLPDRFVVSDVGAACRAVGRFWSKHQAVLLRCERRGWIVRVADGVTPGGRTFRIWEKRTHGDSNLRSERGDENASADPGGLAGAAPGARGSDDGDTPASVG